MKKLVRLAILALVLGSIAAPAFAQVVDEPGLDETPLGRNVSGFLAVTLSGMYVPSFDASVENSGDDFVYRTRQETATVPGFAAAVSLIPAFGNNGVGIEIGYEILGFKWKQDVWTGQESLTGDSTLALSLLSASVNYIRYFLSGGDRIYLLAGGGYTWSTARLVSETGGDNATSDATFPNWRLNAGFGYLHEMSTGAVGLELRSDFPLMDTELNLDDANGGFEAVLETPVMIRLGVVFALGRLR